MHLDKTPVFDGKDDIVPRRFDEPSTDLRLQIEGTRTMINGDKPYPYEIIYERPLRRLNVLRWLGTFGDRQALPSEDVLINIPIVMHIDQYVTSMSFEFFNTSTEQSSYSTTQSMTLTAPSVNNESVVYLVRPITDSGIKGDFTSLKITAKQTGTLSVTSFTTSLPNSVVRGTDVDFSIAVEFASSMVDTSGVHIHIVGSSNGSFQIEDNIAIGSTLTLKVGEAVESGWFEFVLEEDDGYESAIQRVHFDTVPNTPPDVNNVVHNFPTDALSTDVVLFEWSGATDLEGADLTMVITSVQGGFISNMTGIPPNTGAYLFLNTNQTGRCIIRWRIFDGYKYSIEQLFIIKVDSKEPLVDNVTFTVDGVDSNDTTVVSCGVYTCVINGAVSQTDDVISVELDGSSTVEYSKTIVAQGEEFTMTVGCDTPSFKDIYTSMTFVDVNAAKTKLLTMGVEQSHGFDNIGSNAIWLKPGGVTQLVVVGQGGIGEDSIFTGGGVSLVFLGVQAGANSLPEPEDHLIIDLPPEATSFTVETAINTTMDLTW